VVILAGDHIYKMDYSKLVASHEEQGADLTIAALQVSLEEATQFGVMQVDAENRIVGFEEKPAKPKSIPGNPNLAMASMGIYVFNAHFLFDELCKDATLPESSHDFGKNIIPSIINSRRVYAFPFLDENRKAQAYWRDVGTIDSYFEANLELTTVDPPLNLYDMEWPVRTHQPSQPPAKFVFDSDDRRGGAHDSIVSSGVIVSGGHVTRSVIGPQSKIHSYAEVDESILFGRVSIGRRAKLRRTIVDKDVVIPEGFEIGYDLELDRKRGFTVTESGVVVVARGENILS
jgi:glucose-1-phosphate adenylyltransferase